MVKNLNLESINNQSQIQCTYMGFRNEKSFHFEIERLIFLIIISSEMMVTMIMNIVIIKYFPTNALSPLCLSSLIQLYLIVFSSFMLVSSFFTCVLDHQRKWLVLKSYWYANLGRRQIFVLQLQDIRGTSKAIFRFFNKQKNLCIRFVNEARV